jgi:hypothetical protein
MRPALAAAALALPLAVALPCAAQTAVDCLARLQLETWRSPVAALDGSRPR